MRYVYSFFGIVLFSTQLFAHKSAAELSAENALNSEQAFQDGFLAAMEHVNQLFDGPAWRQLTENALQALRNDELRAFDPLVGDTSCELRALLGVIARQELLNGNAPNPDTFDFITLTFVLWQALDSPFGPDGFSIHDRGGENQMCKFLAYLKSAGIRLGGNKNLRKKAISILQRACAYASVIFARRSAAQLENGRDIRDLFLRQCIFDSDDPILRKPIVSCLGIANLTLRLAIARRIPIVVRFRLSQNSFAPSQGVVVAAYVWENGAFAPRNPGSLAAEQAVVVVDALTLRFGSLANPPSGEQVESFIRGFDFLDAWLVHNAGHPQFAGPNRNVSLGSQHGNPIAAAWPALRERALGEGYTRENPAVFSVDHVYVNTLANAMRYNPRESNGQPPSGIIELANARYFPSALVEDFAAGIGYALLLSGIEILGVSK